MTEATVTITPAKTVTIARRDLELLTKAARLFAQLFWQEITEMDLVDGAVDVGLTVDRDAAPEERETTGVDTVVELSPEFERALGAAEETCGLIEEGGL